MKWKNNSKSAHCSKAIFFCDVDSKQWLRALLPPFGKLWELQLNHIYLMYHIYVMYFIYSKILVSHMLAKIYFWNSLNIYQYI